MKVIPFNNRILLQEIIHEKKSDSPIVIPEFIQDRKHLDKFLHCKILDVSSDTYNHLVGCRCVVETGMIEEVVIDNTKYIFAPINYIVCVIQEDQEE